MASDLWSFFNESGYAAGAAAKSLSQCGASKAMFQEGFYPEAAAENNSLVMAHDAKCVHYYLSLGTRK
jgi:hypothetical protein